jgi:hypothetical protein
MNSLKNSPRGFGESATPDLGPPPPRQRSRRGLVAESNSWATEHWNDLVGAVGPTLAGGPRSMSLDLLVEAARQYASGALLDRTDPVVRATSEAESARFGVFHPRTDRDAFIEKLLGRPVPRRPRYRREPPTVPVRLTSTDDLFDLLGPANPTATIATNSTPTLVDQRRLAEALRSALDDDGLLAASLALLERSPDAFVASPLGKWLLSLLHDPIARDSGRPPFEWQFVTLAEVATGVWFGISWWDPSDFRSRRYRAAVAAHLRYLFDYRVAPWNRWPESRARREAMSVMIRPKGETIPTLADRLRSATGELYGSEARSVTIARLYRVSARLRSHTPGRRESGRSRGSGDK